MEKQMNTSWFKLVFNCISYYKLVSWIECSLLSIDVSAIHIKALQAKI